MTATPARVAETRLLDGEPAMQERMHEQARHAVADPTFTDRGQRVEPEQVQARIALIRAHLAAAAAHADAELHDAPAASTDYEGEVLDDEQVDEQAGVEGRGWSR